MIVSIQSKGRERMNLKKTKFYLVGFIAIIVMLSACSDKENSAEDEIKDISKDLILINDDLQLEFEEKMGEFSRDDIDEAEYQAFLEDEVIPQTEELEEYLADYEEPSTELAKEYYDVAHPYISVSNDILLKLGEEQLVGVKGDMTEELAAEFNDDLQEMVGEYDKLRSELLELEKELESEHDISFDVVD